MVLQLFGLHIDVLHRPKADESHDPKQCSPDDVHYVLTPLAFKLRHQEDGQHRGVQHDIYGEKHGTPALKFLGLFYKIAACEAESD